MQSLIVLRKLGPARGGVQLFPRSGHLVDVAAVGRLGLLADQFVHDHRVALHAGVAVVPEDFLAGHALFKALAFDHQVRAVLGHLGDDLGGPHLGLDLGAVQHARTGHADNKHLLAGDLIFLDKPTMLLLTQPWATTATLPASPKSRRIRKLARLLQQKLVQTSLSASSGV
jgi:hypothetical protein